ncbi:transferrin-binding protein-like solute binding protein [Moraxella oblonga]|uniref:transferrin-binding protein-like solute binding protein n=1 Tax=Moraxella oblonga TaxID=200413 RepID=UPI00082A7939|nr:transferrin-binding protein-like solute binding protein [Moraxella oblonga]
MTIKNVRLGCVIAGGLLLGLSGCGSSGGGFGDNSVRSTPIITPNKTNNQNQTTPNRNQNSQNNQNTAQNPNNRNNLATSALNMNNFGFSTPVANKAPLNITYVPRPPAQLAQEVQKVLDGTNRLRAQKGLKPLKLDPNLSAYAQVRASEIAIQFNHKRLDNGTIGNFGENNHGGSPMAEGAVESWRKSAGHYANMVNPSYETIGIGIAYDPNSIYKYYWVQIFNADIYNGKNYKAPYEFIDNTTTNPKPLDQVVINGTAIPLTQLDKQGQWQQIATNGNQGWVNGYQHTRFGVITPQGANASHLYYQGQRTSDVAIPKSGTATYNGTALVVKGSQVNTDVKSQFTANFSTRKLDGKLTQNNATLYNISADINGSGFASKKDAPIQTQGAFFGQNAQELSGVFKDTKTDTKGVFGAKK